VSIADNPALDAIELLRRLTARGVDFVVIGGIAAVLHGSARVTQDLDVCFAADDANLSALGAVLVDLHARLRGVEEEVPFVADAHTLRRAEVLTLVTTLGALDVLARPSGAPTYERLRRRAERFELEGFTVLVAAIDDLIAMKQAAGRAKDLADVAELETIARLRRKVP
jgi:Nucleotidyltransferase of unknown function (DUF6036)